MYADRECILIRRYLRQRNLEPFATNFDEFQSTLCEVNRQLGLPGVFRREDVIFGQGGRHRGVPASEIVPALQRLHNYNVWGGPLPYEKAIERSAQWLLQFFAIHPFLDGNGRTARLILEWMLRPSGIHIGYYRGTEDEAIYLQACDHYHDTRRYNDRPQNSDLYGPMERFLRKVMWVVVDWEEEPPIEID